MPQKSQSDLTLNFMKILENGNLNKLKLNINLFVELNLLNEFLIDSSGKQHLPLVWALIKLRDRISLNQEPVKNIEDRKEIVTILLKNGADPYKFDGDGNSDNIFNIHINSAFEQTFSPDNQGVPYGKPFKLEFIDNLSEERFDGKQTFVYGETFASDNERVSSNLTFGYDIRKPSENMSDLVINYFKLHFDEEERRIDAMSYAISNHLDDGCELLIPFIKEEDLIKRYALKVLFEYQNSFGDQKKIILKIFKDIVTAGKNHVNDVFTTSFMKGYSNTILQSKRTLQNEEKIDTETLTKRSLLHILVAFQATELIEFLIKEINANPNIVDDTSKTPLHYAEFKNDLWLSSAQSETNIEIITLLLSNDCTDPTIKDNHGHSAVDYHKNKGEDKVIASLYEAQISKLKTKKEELKQSLKGQCLLYVAQNMTFFSEEKIKELPNELMNELDKTLKLTN